MKEQLKYAGKVLGKLAPAAVIDGAMYSAAKAGYNYVKGNNTETEDVIKDAALGTGVSLAGRLVAFAVWNHGETKKIQDHLDAEVESLIVDEEGEE